MSHLINEKKNLEKENPEKYTMFAKSIECE